MNDHAVLVSKHLKFYMLHPGEKLFDVEREGEWIKVCSDCITDEEFAEIEELCNQAGVEISRY